MTVREELVYQGPTDQEPATVTIRLQVYAITYLKIFHSAHGLKLKLKDVVFPVSAKMKAMGLLLVPVPVMLNEYLDLDGLSHAKIEIRALERCVD